MKFRRHRRDQPELNVIPLIDILMVLLIFFMVTTTFSRQTQLHLNLPQAGAPADQAPPDGLQLEIDAHGHYRVDGQQVAGGRGGLIATLRGLVRATPQPLLIAADRNTPHQFVMEALDAAGQAGYSKIAFAAEPPAATPP